jgi:hypothetical protein
MDTNHERAGGMVNRRTFLRATSLALGAGGLAQAGLLEGWVEAAPAAKASGMTVADLPKGTAPKPVPFPHFPDSLHAFVWRNWQLVPASRMGEVVGASAGDIVRVGRSMGLSGPPKITTEQQRRAALSIIKRNWQLLPYEQLLQLLGWSAEQMAFTLREDDFFWVKVGNLKPQCEPLRYRPPDEAAQARAKEIATVVRAEFPKGIGEPEEPLFHFVQELSRPLRMTAGMQGAGAATTRPLSGSSAALRGLDTAAPGDRRAPRQGSASAFSPRYCYSYFALYGDPLLDPSLDPYPDGYLARLAASGVDGVWLQAVLTRLAPFPWDPRQSEHFELRLKNLRALVERARKHGIGIYLYLNEPRAGTTKFFAAHPDLKGVPEGDFAALCTSVPEVREYLASAVESICRAAPGLAGFFTISASENLTNCWSHLNGKACPRCGQRPPAEVVAEVNATFYEGIRRAGHSQKLIAWDWGWADDWTPDIIAKLPREVSFMSVSEWGTPIKRGGVETTVGEYSISTIGPSERTRRRWEQARGRGLRTLAKAQFGNTWELSAVPYIPAVANVAQHAANLRALGVNGLMLGWTLGGYPSPNLEVVAEIGSGLADGAAPTPPAAMLRVAERRFGSAIAAQVVDAWQQYSKAFSEFPFHGSVVYSAPMQVGPANPLWGEPTHYAASMVGFPYDDLDAWRAVYPAEAFIGQMEKVASGFERAHADMAGAFEASRSQLTAEQRNAVWQELSVGEASAIHFRTTANQARFVVARRSLKAAKSPGEVRSTCAELERLLRAELVLARRLHAIQSADSRIGFEATNQYYYVPVDLAEKVVNCQDLLTRWLPAARQTAMENVSKG